MGMAIRIPEPFNFIENDYIDECVLTNAEISGTLSMLCYLNEKK